MKNIAAKLVKVMEDCAAVQKNGTNDFHHYKYATSADVLEKVNQSLVKNRVASIVLPEVVDSNEVLTGKGNTEQLVTVKVAITLIDTDSGESIVLAGIGSGQDGGDKAVMKAQTAAIKYAYMLSLAISTNDDPEADPQVDPHPDQNTLHREPVSLPGNKENPLICSDCGAAITSGVRKVSVNKYGRPLCMKCQKKMWGAA